MYKEKYTYVSQKKTDSFFFFAGGVMREVAPGRGKTTKKCDNTKHQQHQQRCAI